MKQSTPIIIDKQTYNHVSIGDLVLESSHMDMDDLICRIVSMLNDPLIKEYLELCKVKRINGGLDYLG